MVRRFFLVALAAAAGCSFPEAPLPPGVEGVVVHAVLDPSRRQQVVELSGTEGNFQAVSRFDSASVVIETPEGIELVAQQDSMLSSVDGTTYVRIPRFRIDLDAAGVNLVPGGTYTLRITSRQGEVITGSTTIPSAVVGDMSAPIDFFRLKDSLRLSWPRVPDAYVYEIEVWQSAPMFSYRQLRHRAFVDSSVVMAGTAKTLDNGDVFAQEQRATVYVFAVDVNYYEYYRLFADPFTGAAPSRLVGAYGVFGSVVPVIRRQLDVK